MNDNKVIVLELTPLEHAALQAVVKKHDLEFANPKQEAAFTRARHKIMYGYTEGRKGQKLRL